MIEVKEARDIVRREVKIYPSENIALSGALRRVLAETVYSGIDIPPFDQSAMDGYAFRYEDGAALTLCGEVSAGQGTLPSLATKGTIRIFTGAEVPADVDTIVMQEHVSKVGNRISIDPFPLDKGANIRKRGTQIRKGDVALEKGCLLNPAAISFLASIGRSHVEVYKLLKTGIVITGNELVSAGSDLPAGKIYESNSFSLRAALEEAGITNVDVSYTKDYREQTYETIRNSLEQHDLLLISGGISVGDYDFVEPALRDCGVETLFYKVAQKPGKPLFFGKKGAKYVFALPGNPASALVCFYEYVLPAIKKASGLLDIFPLNLSLPLKNELRKKSDRLVFYRGRVKDGAVEVLEGQDSFMMKSFALANALVCIPPGTSPLVADDQVEVHLLP